MLWWLLGAYIALFLFAMFLTDGVIFQPPAAQYREGKELVRIRSANGAQIAALYLNHPDAKYTILYSHGNAEDLGWNRDLLEEYHQRGFNVLGYDYQGYGLSEGKPSERNAYADEEAAFQFLVNQKKIPTERIIAVGQSLGGAMAIDLASKHRLGGLIVQSSFTSAFRVLTRFPIVPFDKFNSLVKIKRVSCPVLVIHGKADSVIGFWNGELLYAAAPGPKQKWWVDRGNHNDILLVDAPGYWKAVSDFAATLN
jgi:abhydrolase domain-containing protein 17